VSIAAAGHPVCRPVNNLAEGGIDVFFPALFVQSKVW
jgi:hypothetical protein